MSFETFTRKQFFNDHAYPKFGVRPLDFLNEKVLYGRVDEKQNAIWLPNVSPRLGQLKETKEFILALNFVADAFNDLKRHFDKAAGSQKIPPTGLYAGLEPKRGWRDFDSDYKKYLQLFFDTFEAVIFKMKYHRKIKTFHDYMKIFFLTMNRILGDLPLTRTGFIKSRFCSPFATGLFIDLSTDNANDDQKKKEYIADTNFNFFRNSALKHGFLVDKNVPWRLIADVSSVPMQQYMNPSKTEFVAGSAPEYGLEYAPGTASNLFSTYFIKSHIGETEMLKFFFAFYYNRFLERSPKQEITDIKYGDCAGVIRKVFERQKISSDTLDAYSDSSWLINYFKTRMFEENIFIDKYELKRISSNIKKNLQIIGFNAMESSINKEIILLAGKKMSKAHCQNYDNCGEQSLTFKQEFVTMAMSYNSPLIVDKNMDLTDYKQSTTTGGSSGGGY